MALSKTALVEDLRTLGLRRGDAFLVHSSLKSLGHVSGGADTVTDALLEVVGPEGTVLFPTLTGSVDDSPEHPPVLDVRRTPTWCGLIPDTAWRRPEAVRSLNLTHSVAAIGAQAEALTSGHEKAATPCGHGTPYVKLAGVGGYVLLLGVDHDRNTTFHSAEEIAEMPHVFQERPAKTTITDVKGQPVEVTARLHRWDVPRHFERMHQPLLGAGIAWEGKVGTAKVRLMRSEDLIAYLVDRLKNDSSALFPA